MARCSFSWNIRTTSGVIYFSAISVGALVTKSVPIRFVIRSRSFFFLRRARVRAQNFFWRIYHSSLCCPIDMSGISVPAKNARPKTSKKNKKKGCSAKSPIDWESTVTPRGIESKEIKIKNKWEIKFYISIKTIVSKRTRE